MDTRRDFLGRTLGAAGLVGLGCGRSFGQAAPSTPDLARAVTFLRSRQEPDGSWSGVREPGITALVATALLRSGKVVPEDPAIARALGFLENYLGPKGGLAKAPHSVYATSVALMAFHEANVGGKYDSVVAGNQAFLKGAQYDESEGKDRADPQYGGLGYGDGRSRPDLSNTAFMIEALRDSGVPADDPALQKALVFVSRCQNLKSEFNDQPFAAKVNDGGFIYTSGESAPPGGRGEAKGARTDPDGGIRSTAGMTYSGLKSMIYAGLKPDDLRVKAAVGYIRKNYTLDENPGQGGRGLYYYYMVFARALAALGESPFVDAAGKAHDWKAELAAALAARQEASGAWANRDDRFMEGDPHIVTSYALMALAAK
ncbi:prenyltransferase/squalene oxidase repeat-containing protein [Paludisphaera mucosa]|uniref:Terpene cyclase/mutase family protein n=1 Tax=Paludisphaera mucosa TaxID=3030827 RepID=A0ABT6FJ93_9BACT|nr:prenyltransferase/squalene oxidase repeat-containing protein [Paludisphaera mucosa]MDG3007643.1 terpene cyclase/mutase family protein [Paludisphaera mucosa]